jgi:hypothetical protein
MYAEIVVNTPIRRQVISDLEEEVPESQYSPLSPTFHYSVPGASVLALMFSRSPIWAPFWLRKWARIQLQSACQKLISLKPMLLYSVPTPLTEDMAVGQLIQVPFRTRRLQGIVVGLADRAPSCASLGREPGQGAPLHQLRRRDRQSQARQLHRRLHGRSHLSGVTNLKFQ